jgi:hypothetical protein
VHGQLSKQGRVLCRCWLPGQEAQIGFEVPLWMLDRAHCTPMRLQSEPRVSWQALVELKQLWEATRESVVAKASALGQASAKNAGGKADASTQTRLCPEAGQPIRSGSPSTPMGGTAAGGLSKNHPADGRAVGQPTGAISADQLARRRTR